MVCCAAASQTAHSLCKILRFIHSFAGVGSTATGSACRFVTLEMVASQENPSADLQRVREVLLPESLQVSSGTVVVAVPVKTTLRNKLKS